jgi:hypothetical protein
MNAASGIVVSDSLNLECNLRRSPFRTRACLSSGADPLSGDIEAVGIEMAHGPLACEHTHQYSVRADCVNTCTVSAEKGGGVDGQIRRILRWFACWRIRGGIELKK